MSVPAWKLAESRLERLTRLSMPEPNSGCWIWLAALGEGGYGLVTFDGTMYRAHRVAYEECVGQIPDGLMVMHKCDNRACINPDHLTVGTNQDNLRDAARKGRTARGSRNGAVAKPERLAWGEQNPAAKITARSAKDILDRFRRGETKASLARAYGVGETTVSNVVAGRTWRHATGAP